MRGGGFRAGEGLAQSGALTVRWANRLLGHRWVLFADLLGTAAMMTAPALTTNIWLVSAAAFLGGMGGTLWAVNTRTIAQRIVPTGMFGRYSSVARLFSWGAMPLGAALVGLLAELLGIRVAFGLFALAALATIGPFLYTVTPAALATALAAPLTRPKTPEEVVRS